MSKSFGEVITALRQKAGLSVYAVAQKAGLSDQAVHNLERSERQPSLDTARRLTAALGVTLDWLVSQLPPVDLGTLQPGRPRGRPPKQQEPVPKPKRSRKKP